MASVDHTFTGEPVGLCADRNESDQRDKPTAHTVRAPRPAGVYRLVRTSVG